MFSEFKKLFVGILFRSGVGASLLLFSQISLAENSPPKRVHVLTSTELLASIVQQMLPEESFRVTALISFDEDPHSYELKPKDLQNWKELDYFLFWGNGFEPWIKNFSKQKDFKSKSLKVTQGLPLLSTTPHGHKHGEGHSHHHHDHGSLDPHVWHDPLLMLKLIHTLQSFFTQKFPQSSKVIQMRTQTLKKEISEIHKSYHEKFHRLAQTDRRVVTTHEAFAYLEKSFDIKFYSALGLNSSTEPSAKWMALLIKTVRRENIQCFLGEKNLSPKLIETLAKELNLTVQGEILADNLSKSLSPTYQDFLKFNLSKILECLPRNKEQ